MSLCVVIFDEQAGPQIPHHIFHFHAAAVLANQTQQLHLEDGLEALDIAHTPHSPGDGDEGMRERSGQKIERERRGSGEK